MKALKTTQRLLPFFLFVLLTMQLSAQEGTEIYKQLKEKYARVAWYRNDKLYHISNGNMRGFADSTGKVVFWVEAKCEYFRRGRWDDDVKTMIISYLDEYKFDKSLNMCGAILDENGNCIVPVTNKFYEIYWDDNEEVYHFKKKWDNFEGILDKDGKVWVQPDIYNTIRWDKTNRLFYVEKGKKNDRRTGVLDEHANVLIKPDKYHSVNWSDKYQLFEVCIVNPQGQQNMAGLVDRSGNEVVKPVPADEIIIFPSYSGCFFAIAYTDMSRLHRASVTLYSPKGKALYTCKDPEHYENEIGEPSEGLAAVRVNNQYGYMDVNTGNMAIEPQYTSAQPFHEGLAKVSKGDVSFLIANPLTNGGKSEVISSIAVGSKRTSDIDEKIYETTAVQENTFAVIIANENYDGFTVQYALADGAVFRQYCLKTLGIPQSNIFYYEDATLNNIRGAMTRIHDLADAYDGDAKIVFYYAGQGASDDANNAYLMPTDATLNMIAATGYPVAKLYQELGALNVESSIVLIDAGFNNVTRTGESISTGSRGVAIKAKPGTVSGKTAVLSACTSGETAYAYDEKGHGMFTYYLCKKLKESQGKANLQELGEYIKAQVSRISVKSNGNVQNPQSQSSESIILKNIKL